MVLIRQLGMTLYVDIPIDALAATNQGKQISVGLLCYAKFYYDIVHIPGHSLQLSPQGLLSSHFKFDLFISVTALTA